MVCVKYTLVQFVYIDTINMKQLNALQTKHRRSSQYSKYKQHQRQEPSLQTMVLSYISQTAKKL